MTVRNPLNHFPSKLSAVACVAAYLSELQEQTEHVQSLRTEKRQYNDRLKAHKKSLAIASKSNPDLDVKYGFRSGINGDLTPMGDVAFYIYNNADSFVTEKGFVFHENDDVLPYQVFALGSFYGALCGMHNYLDTQCANEIRTHAKDNKQMDVFTKVMHNVQYDLGNFATNGFNAFADDGWTTAVRLRFNNHLEEIERCSSLVGYFPEKIRTKPYNSNPLHLLNQVVCSNLDSSLQLEEWYQYTEYNSEREFIELVLTELQAYCPPLSLKLHYAYSTTAIQHVLAQPKYTDLRQNTKVAKTELAKVYALLPQGLIRTARKIEK